MLVTISAHRFKSSEVDTKDIAFDHIYTPNIYKHHQAQHIHHYIYTERRVPLLINELFSLSFLISCFLLFCRIPLERVNMLQLFHPSARLRAPTCFSLFVSSHFLHLCVHKEIPHRLVCDAYTTFTPP